MERQQKSGSAAGGASAGPEAAGGLDLKKLALRKRMQQRKQQAGSGQEMAEKAVAISHAGDAAGRALSLFASACVSAKVELKAEADADAELFKMIFELSINMIIPLVSGGLFGKVKGLARELNGGAKAAESAGEAAAEGAGEAVAEGAGEAAAEGAGEAAAEGAGEAVAEGAGKAAEEVTEKEVDVGVEGLKGALSAKAGSLNQAADVDGYIDQLIDAQAGLAKDITNGMTLETPLGAILTIKAMFEDPRITVEAYKEQILKLAREFQSVSGIRRSPDLMWASDHMACWVGGKLAVVKDRGRLSPVRYYFERWIHQPELQAEAKAKTLELGLGEDEHSLMKVDPDEIENLSADADEKKKR